MTFLRCFCNSSRGDDLTIDAAVEHFKVTYQQVLLWVFKAKETGYEELVKLVEDGIYYFNHLNRSAIINIQIYNISTVNLTCPNAL
ncbi:hypothetical protein [Paucilactobacillus oligofermentans]|uniref:hypothetical protein n=1 Tax=Paucilactobacillus oligofermentans TaxID=293371 RepID=UPI00070F9CA5|nr:hypothetical protein [Paucilactobacillus oligofermentans]